MSHLSGNSTPSVNQSLKSYKFEKKKLFLGLFLPINTTCYDEFIYNDLLTSIGVRHQTVVYFPYWVGEMGLKEHVALERSGWSLNGVCNRLLQNAYG